MPPTQTSARIAALSAIALAALICCGCSEFPCTSETTSGTIDPIGFDYHQTARYTYWFEDGAQRSVFDRDEVPETARHAALVFLKQGTSAELPGSMAWWADLTTLGSSSARLAPNSQIQKRAYAAWVGAWAANWVEVNAGVTVARQALRHDALEAAAPGPAPDEADDAPAKTPASDAKPPELIRDQLKEQGIALDELKLQRALRVVGARQPQPRDFGLSFDVHPVWLFTTPDCTACDEAVGWLEAQGIAHHEMRLSDPTNAASLRALAAQTQIEPGSPALWANGTVIVGFNEATYARTIETR